MRILNLGILIAIIIAILCIYSIMDSVPRTGGIQGPTQSKPNAKLSTNTTDTIN